MGIQFRTSFQELQLEQKPREKLWEHGPEALNLWELTALILRTGERKRGKKEDVMQLSKRLLAETGFKGLFTQKTPADVQENFDTYKSHAEMIVAISEICRRLHGKFDVFDAAEPSKIFQRFAHLKEAKQEHCFVLHIDQDKKCVFQEMVAIGSSHGVQVYPNDILRTPIWIGTKEIIVVHNHPGTCLASKEDISWTLALSKGSFELHQIKIRDHIIIGTDGYFSFFEKGLL